MHNLFQSSDLAALAAASSMLYPVLKKRISSACNDKGLNAMKQPHFLFFVRVVTLTEKRLAFRCCLLRTLCLPHVHSKDFGLDHVFSCFPSPQHACQWQVATKSIHPEDGRGAGEYRRSFMCVLYESTEGEFSRIPSVVVCVGDKVLRTVSRGSNRGLQTTRDEIVSLFSLGSKAAI